MPNTCPTCESKLVKNEDDPFTRCINSECPDQIKRLLEHYCSKSCVDIEGLGEGIIKQLFDNQIKMNKALEGTEIEVLVENKTHGNSKFFGRSEYMTSVIFDGNYQDVGNVIKVKIKSSNQNSLFGESINNSEQRVA